MMGCEFIFVVITECNFTKKENFAQALRNVTQIFFHQIKKQEETVKYKKENFMNFITL